MRKEFRYHIAHMPNLLHFPYICAAEEKGVVHVSFCRGDQGSGDAVWDFCGFAVVEALVAFVEKFIPFIHFVQENVGNGTSRHSHGAFYNTDVICIGFYIGFFIADVGIALPGRYEAGGTLDTVHA